ncbi:two-component sensor histidine kinase, partial [Streptomyces xanthophaeus]
MRRFTLRTGIRWKITLAIAAVGALTAVALSLVVHSAARVSMLESAREVQLDRVQFMSRNVDAGRKPPLGFKINDPDLPAQLRQKVQSG